jgi:hypothetical protein
MPKQTPRSGWREEVLKRDNYQCQFRELVSWFPVKELVNVPCSRGLQVHHKTYARFGHELPEDGVTLCEGHHDIITDVTRRLRYHARRAQVKMERTVKMVRPLPGKVKEREKVKFYHRGNSTIIDAQREIGRQGRPVQSEDERDHLEQEENRRRLRRTQSSEFLGRSVS